MAAPLQSESTFDELLKMLHQEHETELETLRQQLQERIAAMQTELLDAKRKLVSMQIEKEKVQNDDELDNGGHNPHKSFEQSAVASSKNGVESSPEDLAEDAPKLGVGLLQSTSMKVIDIFKEPLADFSDPGQKEENKAKEKEEEEVEQKEATKEKDTMEDELEEIRKWTVRPCRKHKHIIFTHHQLPSAKWQKVLLSIVNKQSFEIICAIAILSNAAFMGAQIDYIVRHTINPDEAPPFFQYLDSAYSLWFVMELLLKMGAFGCSFFYRQGWTWNVFDFIVVSTDALQYVMEWIVGSHGTLGNLTFLRMLRVLRVTRAIRVVRLVRFFRELRIMIASVMKCGTSLMWSMLLFFLIIYIFSIFLLNAVAFFVHENESTQYYEEYRYHWSSLPQGMWTLFSCMTGGVSWMEVGDPLTNISWAYGGVLGFFMFFTIFVVTNIITGIFVDTAIQNAESDRDEVVQEELHSRDAARLQLKAVFDEADSDKSGKLTMEEFEGHLHDERVKAHLDSIGLHVDEARALFRLLDIHQSHQISIEEFLFGCMRLKGNASSIDLATLMYENKRNAQVFNKCHKDMMRAVGTLQQKIEAFERLETAENIEIQKELATADQNLMTAIEDEAEGLVLRHI